MPGGSGNRARSKTHVPYAGDHESSIISTPGGIPRSRMRRAYPRTDSWVGVYGMSIHVLYCGARNIRRAGARPAGRIWER